MLKAHSKHGNYNKLLVIVISRQFLSLILGESKDSKFCTPLFDAVVYLIVCSGDDTAIFQPVDGWWRVAMSNANKR